MQHPDHHCGSSTPISGSEALVMAAGAGRRFGGGKLLADWRGRPLIAAAVTTALQAPVERVTVVLGCTARAVEMALAPLNGPRLRTVVNTAWADGLSSSLRAGLKSLPATARYVVMFLGDMPMVPTGLASQLLRALVVGAPAALACRNGLPAHPVAFRSSMFDQLCDLKGDRGGRLILERTTGAVFFEAPESGSQFDVDRPQDLLAAL